MADFIVGQTSVSSQTSMVNFNTTRMTKWQVVLIARRAGEFVIPALTVENQKSEPIELTVLEANTANNDKEADIFVTSELSRAQVYVQQLLTLTIKLHFSVELKSGNLTEPSLTGATIEKVGQDKQSDSIINGKRYRVIEQTYAITPEQSGEFTLQAPLFSGEVLQASKRRSSFLSFAQTKPVSIVGESLKIDVMPIPTNYPSNAQWLPTEILTLHQEWQSNKDNFVVGEPITRTITLTAAGLSKAQLPKLEMKSSRGLKIYPDQAELNSNLSNGRLVSQKVQNFALVPSAAGEFTLPAMIVSWFNTYTNKIEQATLPAETITVKMAEGGDVVKANNNQAIHSQATENLQITNTGNTNPPLTTLETGLFDNSKQWLFLSLWLLTTLAWFLHISYLKKSVASTAKRPRKSSKAGDHYLALQSACKKNDAEQALQLILPWLRQLLCRDEFSPSINNIAQAHNLIQEQSFATALNDLQQHLYGKSAINGAPSWQGLTLLSAIQLVNQQHSVNNSANQPLSLNP